MNKYKIVIEDCDKDNNVIGRSEYEFLANHFKFKDIAGENDDDFLYAIVLYGDDAEKEIVGIFDWNIVSGIFRVYDEDPINALRRI